MLRLIRKLPIPSPEPAVMLRNGGKPNRNQSGLCGSRVQTTPADSPDWA